MNTNPADAIKNAIWSIVIEATCLVLSGQIDKLIEEKGETNDLDSKKDAEEKQ